jgi:hypothetical protein
MNTPADTVKVTLARRDKTRLERLVASGILRRAPYQKRPPRYEYQLTEKVIDLWPVRALWSRPRGEGCTGHAGPGRRGVRLRRTPAQRGWGTDGRLTPAQAAELIDRILFGDPAVIEPVD